jgi:hypothetical protein
MPVEQLADKQWMKEKKMGAYSCSSTVFHCQLSELCECLLLTNLNIIKFSVMLLFPFRFAHWQQ